MPAANCLGLSSIGSELDAARRSRAGWLTRRATDGHASASSTASSPSSTQSIGSETEVDRPFPLCLLCLVRPPSAVLLPCCHLSLCHICAPLLIMKHKTACEATTVPDESSITDAELLSPTRPSPRKRPSWNSILARATARHSKSRALSMGGYVPPEIGTLGGEMVSAHLLPDQDRAIESGVFSRSIKEDGRVGLATLEHREDCAKCLICRSGVQGWLRVYTG